MARLPVSPENIIEAFGPHLNFTPKDGFPGRDEPDKSVKTHCCFCAMQCGIELLVKNNKVVGFEPWMEFPFNEGRLCPKGVQRYLQNNHPDRLLNPLMRSEGVGFVPTTWDNAYDKTIAEMNRIQEKYGNDAFAVLSGVSLSNEKSYLMGKFARVALKTKNLDYNGRLCMVSAGAGNKKAFGLDRASNNYSDLEYAEVIIVAGANVSETFPTLTHWIWKARDRGAKLIVIDPRMTPIARTAEIHLDVRPGTDSALYGAMLKYLVDHDMLDQQFIAEHTSGFAETIDAVKDYTLEWAEVTTGINKEKIRQAAELWGKAKTSFLLHARGIEHHSKGVDNVLGLHQLGAWLQAESESPIVATRRLQARGMGKAVVNTATNATNCRAIGILKIWNIANTSPRSGAFEESELPRKGLTAYEIIDAIHRGEIKGLAFDMFQSTRILAQQQLRAGGIGKAGVLCLHRLLPQRNSAPCRHHSAQDRCKKKRRGRRHPPKAA
jgi:assimilatory nitrate reductase catalytic subunit